jgi:hypothetical protein
VAFYFFLTFGGLTLTPKNEKHEKDLFTNFRNPIYFSGTGPAYIETDDL